MSLGIIQMLIAVVCFLIGGLTSKASKGANIIGALIVGVISFCIGLWGYIPISFTAGFIWFNFVAIIIGSIVGIVENDEFWPGGITIIGVICIGLLIGMFSEVPFRANDISSIITPKEVSPKYVQQHTDQSKIRLVPRESAIRKSRMIISEKNYNGFILGSVLKIDETNTTIQKVEDKSWWIIPLEYQGVFEQGRLGDIPGFIAISAYDPGVDPMFISESPVDGEKMLLKASLNGNFKRFGKRRMKMDNPFQVLDDYSYEVDDNWHPMIVASIMEPQVGAAKFKVIGVKIMDLLSGTIKDYSLENLPPYVDRAIPVDNALKRIDQYAYWKEGWPNPSNKGRFKTTVYKDGNDMFFVEMNNETYWFSGLTSISDEDNSLVGGVYFNTRKYEVLIVNDVKGPDENGVIDAINASLGEKAKVWHAEDPIPYRIMGTMTWVAPIISTEKHFWQGVGLMSMENDDDIVWDLNLRDALRGYMKELNGGNEVDVDAVEKVYEGLIESMNLIAVKNNLISYFKLKNVPKAFEIDADEFPEFCVIKNGTKVKIKVLDTGEKRLRVKEYLNPFLKGESQRNILEIGPQKEVGVTLDMSEEFDKLTPEQKRKLMEKNKEE